MDIDKATQTMIDNLHKNSGKTLEEWIDIVKKENLVKHGEIIKFLKDKHEFTHGFANLVAHRSKASDAASVENKDDLITAQYKGKESLKPIYDQLVNEIKTWSKDLEIAPKKAYVSLRRNKQFATLTPATKTRFEIGLILKGEEAKGILEAEKPNTMCTHKIKITQLEDLNNEVLNWVKKAFDKAL